MATPRAKDVTFSSDDQANKTMILDLGPDAAEQAPRAIDQEATVVLDLSATQVRHLLEDTATDSIAKGQYRS